MGAVGTPQAQKTVCEDTTLKKGIEFLSDEIGQARPALKLDLGQKGLEVVLYQLVEGGVFGTPPLGSSA